MLPAKLLHFQNPLSGQVVMISAQMKKGSFYSFGKLLMEMQVSLVTILCLI